MSLQVPCKEHYSAVSYFVSENKFEEGSVGDRFLKGDDSLKNTRLKLIANIFEGPWIVKKAVGEQAICILGRSLTCRSTSTLLRMYVVFSLRCKLYSTCMLLYLNMIRFRLIETTSK